MQDEDTRDRDDKDHADACLGPLTCEENASHQSHFALSRPGFNAATRRGLAKPDMRRLIEASGATTLRGSGT
jgi:hypothetical protein